MCCLHQPHSCVVLVPGGGRHPGALCAGRADWGAGLWLLPHLSMAESPLGVNFPSEFHSRWLSFTRLCCFSPWSPVKEQKQWAGCDSYRPLRLFLLRLVFFHVSLLVGTSYPFLRRGKRKSILPEVFLSSLRWVVPPVVITLFYQSTQPLCGMDPSAAHG